MGRYETALQQWKCPGCGGRGTYQQDAKGRVRAVAGGRTPNLKFQPDPVTCKVCKGDGLDPIASAALAGRDEALGDAFDLGFKAAGGTMVPDAAKNWSLVEMALDRETIDALADVADVVLADPEYAPGFEKEAPLLRQFLENISIYRRKK